MPDFFKELKSFALSFAKGKDLNIEPLSLISAGPKQDAYSVQSESIDRISAEQLEKYYRKCGYIFTAVNAFAELVFGQGGYVDKSKDVTKDSADICQKAMSLPSFRPSGISSISHTYLYGKAFQEQIWNGFEGGKNKSKKQISRFVSIDPKTMETFWDKHGQITRFDQKTLSSGKEEKVIFEIMDSSSTKNPNPEIVYYKFFQIADNMNGMGYVEPITKDIDSYEDIKQSIRETFHMFSLPQFHVVKEGAKTEQELTKVSELFHGFNRRSFFATSEKYKVNSLVSSGKIPDLHRQADMIFDNICAGLRFPKPFLMGRAEAGRLGSGSDMQQLREFMKLDISAAQQKLTSIWEQQIFLPLCLANGNALPPDWLWNPLSDDDEQKQLANINTKIQGLSQAVSSGLIDQQEAKKMLKEYMESKRSTV